MSHRINSKKELEIFLEKLERPPSYKNWLEQYPTDPGLAAHIATLAFLDGNVAGKTVADLGAGFGILSVAFAALGASRVIAVEVDSDLVNLGMENANGFPIDYVNSDVRGFSERVNTVVMNPPFGSVNPHSDVDFLEKAVCISENIYSLHNAKSANFVENFLSSHGTIIRREEVSIRIPRIYGHHKKDWMDIPAFFFTTRVVSSVENPQQNHN